jgi:LacI family transcriptional regulator
VPDEIQGGYHATCALLEAGYQRIAFINVNNLNPGIPASHGRLEGYKQALQQYGIAFNQELVRFGTGTPSDGYNYGMELLGLDNPPTAIFCGNDRTAMGTYDALRELGLRVCDDIAIVGFDNLEVIAAALHPSLSTMQLPHYEMGKWAVEYLLNYDANDMNEGQAVQHKILCPYIERQSL